MFKSAMRIKGVMFLMRVLTMLMICPVGVWPAHVVLENCLHICNMPSSYNPTHFCLIFAVDSRALCLKLRFKSNFSSLPRLSQLRCFLAVSCFLWVTCVYLSWVIGIWKCCQLWSSPSPIKAAALVISEHPLSIILSLKVEYSAVLSFYGQHYQNCWIGFLQSLGKAEIEVGSISLNS